jgi:hypothetical protein
MSSLFVTQTILLAIIIVSRIHIVLIRFHHIVLLLEFFPNIHHLLSVPPGFR